MTELSFILPQVIRKTSTTECSICLALPVAGRVDKCGHIHCWACILHYTAVNETKLPPCPVCAKPLHVKIMKPTRIVQWKSPVEEVNIKNSC